MIKKQNILAFGFAILVVLTTTSCAQRTNYLDFEQIRNSLSLSSLPIINISNMDGEPGEEKMAADFEIAYYDCEKKSVKYRKEKCLVKKRGGVSMNYPKHNMNVTFVDDEGDEKDVNLLGLREGCDKWILGAMLVDCHRMRNRVCYDLWNSFSRLPYSTKYDGINGIVGDIVEVFEEGQYMGIYHLSEKMRRKLLGLKKQKHNGKVRGVLYKCKSFMNGFSLRGYDEQPMDGEMWNSWQQFYPNDYSVQSWTPLKQLIDVNWDALHGDEFMQEVKKHFYMQNIIDIYILINALGIEDLGYKNMYLSCPNIQDENPQFVITPWDMDGSFSYTWSGIFKNDTVSMSGFGTLCACQPFRTLIQDKSLGFQSLVAERWTEVKDKFTPERVRELFLSYARRMKASGAWSREKEKWDDMIVPLESDPETSIEELMECYTRNYATVDARWSNVRTKTTDASEALESK